MYWVWFLLLAKLGKPLSLCLSILLMKEIDGINLFEFSSKFVLKAFLEPKNNLNAVASSLGVILLVKVLVAVLASGLLLKL